MYDLAKIILIRTSDVVWIRTNLPPRKICTNYREIGVLVPYIFPPTSTVKSFDDLMYLWRTWWLYVTKPQTCMLSVCTEVYYQAELTFNALQPVDDTPHAVYFLYVCLYTRDPLVVGILHRLFSWYGMIPLLQLQNSFKVPYNIWRHKSQCLR